MIPSSRTALLDQIHQHAVLRRVWEYVRQAAADDAAHDGEHLLRVALSTIRLAGAKVALEDAICAALLHDVVNLPKNHPQRAQASRLSGARAREVLSSAGFSTERLDGIVEAIEDHSYSSGRRPRSRLGEALQDADRLEALGALGIARTFSTGVRLGASYFHPDDPWATHRTADDVRFSVDHFFTKLLSLPATLCTAEGRQEAERRALISKQFLLALSHEIGVPLDPERLESQSATRAH